MNDSVAIPPEQLPPGDWVFTEDGLFARLEEADADIQLHIDQSAIEKEPFAGFELPNARMVFTCPYFKATIPIKRRIAGSWTPGDRDYLLSPVWVASYASIFITLNSGQVVEAPKLDRESWFAFDLVFYSALAHWPELEQESLLANPVGEHRLLALLGGYASFGWFTQLTKLTGSTHNLENGTHDPELAKNNPELLDGLRSIWKVNNGPNISIENCRNGDVLEDGLPITFGRQFHKICGGSENGAAKLLKFRYAKGTYRIIPLGISNPPSENRTTYIHPLATAFLENGVKPENLLQTILDAEGDGLLEPVKLPEVFKLTGNTHQNWEWLLRVSEAIWVASHLCPEHYAGPLGRIKVGWLVNISGATPYALTLFPGQFNKTIFGSDK